MKDQMYSGILAAFVLFLSQGPAFSQSASTNSATKIYRLSEVEEAKKRAAAEGKPIAWIGGVSEHLVPYENLKAKGSHPATAYAIRALQNDAILCFSDGRTENHTEPPIVDQALHTPNSHYTMPYVIVLTPELDKVICKIPYTESFDLRVGYYKAALQTIRSKSWKAAKAAESAEDPKPEPPAKEDQPGK